MALYVIWVTCLLAFLSLPVNWAFSCFRPCKRICKPVSVFGLAVEEGDLVHADRHGALVIPSLVIPSLQHAIEKLIATERLVLDPASKPDFD